MDWNSALWGIAGIFATILFYKLSQKSKRLIYDKQSKPLITNSISKIDGLNITYKNKPVESLTNTTIRFKSTGKGNINKTDYAERFPLTIQTDGEFIIQEDIKSILENNSNKFNKIEFIPIDKSKIIIEIDFLKHNNWFTLNIFHTGNLKVTGELKDGKILCSSSINKMSISDILYIIGMSLGIVFILLLSFIENGFGFYITQTIKLFFNIALGIILIEFYHKICRKNDSYNDENNSH